MNFVIRLIVSIVAVWLTVRIGSLIHVGLNWPGLWDALVFIIVLSVVNALIRPMVKLFALPINCLTFGLFALVVNALLFWLADAVTGGKIVEGFLGALFGSIVLAVVSGVLNSFVKRRRESVRM